MSKKHSSVILDPTIRPVLILGPLSDCVAEKLFTDFPDRFQKCLPEISQYSDQDYLERHNLIDFKRRGDAVECTTIQCIESVCNQVCFKDFLTFLSMHFLRSP